MVGAPEHEMMSSVDNSPNVYMAPCVLYVEPRRAGEEDLQGGLSGTPYSDYTSTPTAWTAWATFSTWSRASPKSIRVLSL